MPTPPTASPSQSSTKQNPNQFTSRTNEAKSRHETFTGVSSALEIGAAAPTSAARSTTDLQIGHHAALLAQARVIIWRASPLAASFSLPNYDACPDHRLTKSDEEGTGPSMPFHRRAPEATMQRAMTTRCFSIPYPAWGPVHPEQGMRPGEASSPHACCASCAGVFRNMHNAWPPL